MAAMRALRQWFDARRRTIASALVAWVVVIAFAAGPGIDGSAWVDPPDLGGVLAAMAIAVGAIGLALVALLRPGVAIETGQRRRLTVRGLLIALALVVAVVVLTDGGEIAPPAPPESEAPALTLDPEIASEDPVAVIADGSDLAALALIAALAASVLVWSRTRHAGDATSRTSATSATPEILGPIMARAADLLAHGDPRTAVMAAYAHLEGALADLDLGRRRVETPTEHLTRVLANVPTIAAPTLRLARLYELARFSDAPITSDDRTDALGALADAQRRLAEGSNVA